MLCKLIDARALVVQGEEEGPGDILDEELQKQLNEIADYDSDDAIQPTAAAGQFLSLCIVQPLLFPQKPHILVQACLASHVSINLPQLVCCMTLGRELQLFAPLHSVL